MEPPSRLEFSNSSGGWLDCSASGSPQPSIDWLSIDGTSIGDVGGIRRVLRNGTLVLLPFPAAAYRQDIHSTIYRCVASNRVGRIISRDVQVRAGKFPCSTHSTFKSAISSTTLFNLLCCSRLSHSITFPLFMYFSSSSTCVPHFAFAIHSLSSLSLAPRRFSPFKSALTLK
jgi:hypothetical protein